MPKIVRGYGPTPFYGAALMPEWSTEEKTALLAFVHRVRLLARTPTAAFAYPVCLLMTYFLVTCLTRTGH
jgi:hypothetical protein